MPSMPLHLAATAAWWSSSSPQASLDEGVGGDIAADTLTSSQGQNRQRPKLSKLSSFECASLSSGLLDPNQAAIAAAAQGGSFDAAALAAPSVDHLTHSLPGVGPMAGMAALAAAGLAEATSDIVPPVTTVGSSHYLQLPSAGVASSGRCILAWQVNCCWAAG